MSTRLLESRPFTTAEASPGSPDGIPVILIDVGWGSSGYYSESVLKNAARAGVFATGLQMFLDHPGAAENYDRPERSVRDLVASLTENAVYDESAKALVSYARPMGANALMLEDKEFLRNIGLSIRAFGDSTLGEAEGRKGQIITELTEAISVDFVTRAGRGGRVLVDLMESARPEQVAGRAVENGVAEATANETRQALQRALESSYGGEKTWVWVRDFDESSVWFQYESPDVSGTYEEAYTMAGSEVTLDGTAYEVRAQTTYVRVNQESEKGDGPAPTKPPAPAGKSTATESEETNMASTQIEESRLAALEKDSERVQSLESEINSLRLERSNRTARDRALEMIRESSEGYVPFSDLEIAGLLSRVSLDENSAFRESDFSAILESVLSKREKVESKETNPFKVRGFGTSAVESSDSTLDKGESIFREAESAAADAFGRTVKGA